MGRVPVAEGAALEPSSDAAASFSTTTHSDEGDDSPLPPAAALSGAEPGSSERAATPSAEISLTSLEEITLEDDRRDDCS